MEQILQQAAIYSNIIGEQQPDDAIKYNIATFIAITEYDNKILLFNTLSREMIALKKREFDNLYNGVWNELYTILIKKRFLVPIQHDDYKLCNQIISVAKALDNNKNILKYVIMPTMECNARCFYCFEHGAKRYPMTNEVANDVANFILKNSDDQKISIQWFGGEPLFNTEPIDIISTRLKQEKINFESKMITNGYLFDQNMILKALNIWNLKTIQITLDGTEKVYNKTKNYIYKNELNAFERVINNIQLLVNHKIKVIIRLNLDNHNSYDLYNLINYIIERFEKQEDYISIYVWLLYDNRGSQKKINNIDDKIFLTDLLIKLEDYIEKSGFSLKSHPNAYLEYRACLADTDNSTIILPNGNLGCCDHHSDDEIYGSIYSDSIDYDVVNSWKIHHEHIELCKTCPLLPQCHKVAKCPEDGGYICDEHLQKHRINTLHRQMRNAYKDYIERHKDDLQIC